MRLISSLVPICLGLLLLCGEDLKAAQTKTIWMSGSFSLAVPADGNCGENPILKIKGPGILSIPDSNVFRSIEIALPAAIAEACPGVRQVTVKGGYRTIVIQVSQPSTSHPIPPTLRASGQRGAAPVPNSVSTNPPDPQITRQRCLEQSNKILANFVGAQGCQTTEAQLGSITRQWVGVKIDTCGDDKSFHDDIDNEKDILRIERDHSCLVERLRSQRSLPMNASPTPAIDDFSKYNVPRFFSDDTNRTIWSGDSPNGIVLGGRLLTPDELYSKAFDIFLAMARVRGIETSQISRAIFEGRLNPHWDDLTLVFYGLNKYIDPNYSSIWGRNVARNLKWIELFGSFGDFGHVRTLVDGQWRDQSGLEIAARLKKRSMSDRPVEEIEGRMSAYAFFSYQSGDQRVSGFHGDYFKLRALSETPLLAQREADAENDADAHRYSVNSGQNELTIGGGVAAILGAAIVASLLSSGQPNNGAATSGSGVDCTCTSGYLGINHGCFRDSPNGPMLVGQAACR